MDNGSVWGGDEVEVDIVKDKGWRRERRGYCEIMGEWIL